MLRRLLRCLLSAVVVSAGFTALLPEAAATEPRVASPAADKLLLLDRRVVESADNARLELGAVVKEARNPLLPSDQPWENATNNYYPNVLWDADERQWKLWYKDVLADPDAIARMDRPSTVHDVGWFLLYATSRDGLSWQRPALGLHRFAGSADTNAVARDCPNVGVFKDAHDPDPRRYKMVYDVGLGQPRARFSADGVHWSEPQQMLGFTAQQGDTHNNAFFDPHSGKYLWFTKLYLGERLVTRLESDDFLHWRSSGVVLRSTLDEGRATQTYALTVFPYAGLYLGYAMMYHLGHGRTVDCELAWSPDSVHWERVRPGTPLLALGKPGSYDSGCIYAQAGPPVVQDDDLLIYYGGSPTVHLGWKRSASLCLARLRTDCFAGYEAADAGRPAVLMTTPLRATDQALRLVSSGEVKSERLPASDDTFRLRLTIAPGARLYAIVGATLVNPALPEPRLAPLRRAPPRSEPLVFGFDRDSQGWQGLDRVEHQAEGYLTVSRGKNLRPFVYGTPLPGDWSALLGGTEATLSARVRCEQPGGPVRLEIFALDVASWSYDKLPPLASEWQTIAAALRYDWTDAEARAAGWTPSPQGFSWRETITHVGKVVVASGQTGAQSFDLDEVRIEAR